MPKKYALSMLLALGLVWLTHQFFEDNVAVYVLIFASFLIGLVLDIIRRRLA